MHSLRRRLFVYLIGGAAGLLLVTGFALRATIAAWLEGTFGRIERDSRQDLMPEFRAAPDPDGSLNRRPPLFDLTDETRGRSLAGSSHPATTPNLRDVRRPDGRRGNQVPIDVVPPLDGRDDPAETGSAPVQEPSSSRLPAAPFIVARARPRLDAGVSRPEIGFAGIAAGRMRAAKVQLFIEYNATAGDGGIQAFFDGQAWKRVKIVGPDGRTILQVTPKRALKQLDLTELRFESEPPLAEVLQKFPPGEYAFEGTTVEGQELGGAATLSHDIPDPAVIVPVDPNSPVIAWSWTPGPGSPIQALAGFQVIVENDLDVSITVDLPPSMTSLTVPPEFLRAGTAYTFEVLAIAANGNRTVTEGTFVTPEEPL